MPGPGVIATSSAAAKNRKNACTLGMARPYVLHSRQTLAERQVESGGLECRLRSLASGASPRPLARMSATPQNRTCAADPADRQLNAHALRGGFLNDAHVPNNDPPAFIETN